MKARLISWAFARDLNQWIPAGDDDRYINASVERTNLTPIAFEELRK